MKYFLTLLGLPLFLASSAFALGPFSLGVKGGVALTDAFPDHTDTSGGSAQSTYSDSKDYIVGPMVELRLPFGLGVEADALYRPLHLTTQTEGLGHALFTSSTTSSWEFPILAKYRFGFPLVHPYIEAGPSFRTLGGTLGSSLSDKGFTGGAGIELNALLLRVAPEFRYTHWGNDTAPNPSGGASVIPSNRNQVEFLVGLSF
jgi:hypothetical protein